MKLRIRKVYTYPCQCGDPCGQVMHTFSRRKAVERTGSADINEMWSIFEGEGDDVQVIADCGTLAKAKRVLTALEKS